MVMKFKKESKELANHLDDTIKMVCINCESADYVNGCKEKCGFSRLRFVLAEFICRP
jgi:hypothetical protein